MNKLQRIIYQLSHHEISELEAEQKIEQWFRPEPTIKEKECLCHTCAWEGFSDYYEEALRCGITTTIGTCPSCGNRNVPLVQIRDLILSE